MILQERNVPPFGGRVTDIDNKTFLCVVTTAKNSLFEGLSTNCLQPRRWRNVC